CIICHSSQLSVVSCCSRLFFYPCQLMRRTPTSPLFPYTTLFRSCGCPCSHSPWRPPAGSCRPAFEYLPCCVDLAFLGLVPVEARSEEHTSELQSRFDLVCRLLLEKKNTNLSQRRS